MHAYLLRVSHAQKVGFALSGGDMDVTTVLRLAKRRTRPRRNIKYPAWVPYFFVSPAILFYAVIYIFPIAWALYISVHKFQIGRPDNPFVGLENYRYLFFDDKIFRASLVRTFYFSFGFVLTNSLVGLILALLMNRWFVGRYLYRMAFFIPVVTSIIPMAIVWKFLYNTDLGLFNGILNRLFGFRIPWLSDEKWAIPSLIIMATWRRMGYAMMVYLAGLQDVPREHIEAAMVDGANAWQRFWHVIWPALAPTTLFVLVTSSITGMLTFGEIYVMTEGGPGQATTVLSYYIYRTSFEFLKMGRGAAMSFVLFIFIFILTLIQLRYARGPQTE